MSEPPLDLLPNGTPFRVLYVVERIAGLDQADTLHHQRAGETVTMAGTVGPAWLCRTPGCNLVPFLPEQLEPLMPAAAESGSTSADGLRPRDDADHGRGRG